MSVWVQFCVPGGPNGAVGSHFGGLGGRLDRPRGACGSHFGGLGLALGAFGRQLTPESAPLQIRRSILEDFGAQREAKRHPK